MGLQLHVQPNLPMLTAHLKLAITIQSPSQGPKLLPQRTAREKKIPYTGKAFHSCELACLCRAQLHGSAAAHAAQPARAAQPSQASTSKPGAQVSASKPGRKKEEDAMQRLIRQRTAGGRVQVPPTMQHGMAQVSAPLSPNILAEPYKYEPHPIIASHAMSAGRTDSLCVYNVAFSLSHLLLLTCTSWMEEVMILLSS